MQTMKINSSLLVFLATLFFVVSLPAQEYMKKKNGQYKVKFSNGQIETIGKIEDHLKTGEWKTYTFNGQLKSAYTYSKGLLNGPYALYFDNGKKQEEGNYTNGIKTGELKEWFENGNRKSVRHYNAAGKETGLQEYWNMDGVKILSTLYKEDGTQYRATYFPFGGISMREQFLNGKREGPQYYYRKTNGKVALDTFPKEIETYHNGIKEGASKRFGKNNVLIAEYYYKNNKLDSVGREWNEKGELKFEFYYKENKLDGYCINYDEGKKTAEGRYKEGKLTGLHIQYTGELCYTWYSNDEMDSCRCYHDNKKLRLHYAMIDPAQKLLKGTVYDTLGKKSQDWITKDNLTEGPSHYYYSNGKIKSTFSYHEGIPSGTIEAWSPSRKLVLRIPLDKDGNSSTIEAWSDAGATLTKGTSAFNAQVKKYLPTELYFDETNGQVLNDYEEAPPMELIIDDPPPPPADIIDRDEVYSFAETMPLFPQGFNAYLKENLKYPEEEKLQKKQGTVYVYFVVERDGSVTDVRIAKAVKDAPGLSLEAIRVIGTMPNWTPGTMQGRPVRIGMTQPVKFVLD
jgi:TonB family protein